MSWVTFGVDWLPNMLAPMLSAKFVDFSALFRSVLVCLAVAMKPCTPRVVFLTAWTKIRFSLSSTLQTPLTVYTETTCSKPLGTLFLKSTVFASRLTATIPSYSSAISHHVACWTTTRGSIGRSVILPGYSEISQGNSLRVYLRLYG